MDVTTTNPLAFSSKWLVQQARVELAAKFLFIYALLDKVVVAAAHCYRLQQRTKGDSKGDVRLTSLTKTMEPRQPAVQPTEDERVRASLKLSLLSFDRAKAALHWLRRDYELSYASYRVNELPLWTMDARNELLYDIDTLPVLPRSTMDVLMDTRAVNANAHDIQQLNALLAVLQKKVSEVEIAVLRNEKSSLDIALDYLADDGDGRVRAEDCTDFDQRLMFPILSGHHDYITRKSMRQGVLELSAVIERNSNKVKAIIALGTQLGKKDKVELNASLDAIHTNRSRLHHIYQSLHQAFVHYLFVSEKVTQSAVHVGRVRQDLVEMEARVVEALDPMTLQHCCEEENKDEIVPNEGHGVKLLHNELVSYGLVSTTKPSASRSAAHRYVFSRAALTCVDLPYRHPPPACRWTMAMSPRDCATVPRRWPATRRCVDRHPAQNRYP